MGIFFPTLTSLYYSRSYTDLWVELNKESFPLEAQLTDLGPVEGIDFRVTLN